MVVCIKASLWEAYSVQHKTIKITAMFISILFKASDVLNTLSFQEKGWHWVPFWWWIRWAGISTLTSGLWVPAAPAKGNLALLTCRDKSSNVQRQRCLQWELWGFRASVKLPVALISVPVIWSNLYLCPKRGGMFPSDNALAQVLLEWVMVWGRSSYSMEPCFALKISHDLCNQLMNKYLSNT